MMLKQLFISEVRVRVLYELLLKTDEPLHVREIVRRVGTEINAVRRELRRLKKIGLLKPEQRGNRLYYHVNRNFSLYPELLAMLVKGSGLGRLVIDNLPRLGEVKLALLALGFVQGRVAGSKEVDLLIVGESIDLGLLGELVRSVEKERGQEINYTVLNSEELEWRKNRKDPFLLSIITGGRIILTGDECQLRVS